MTTQTQTQVQTRTVTVYSSQGKNKNKITFSGTTWGELKRVLADNGYNIGSMKAIENIRKSTLENPKAVLPEGDFNVHLYPVKTKSGADRKELMSKIRAVVSLKDKVGEKAQKHFNGDTNYTRRKTEELEKLVEKWEKKNGPISADEVAAAPAPKKATKATVKGTKTAVENGVADVVDSVIDSKKNPRIAIKTSYKLLNEIDSSFENYEHVQSALISLEKSLAEKPSKSEEEILRQEHDELAEGVEGIQRY